MSDLEALLARAQSGDAQARDELARALYELLERHFARRVRTSRVESDDLMQATMAVVVGRIDSFRPMFPGAFRVFVYRTADLVLRKTQQRASARAARSDVGDRRATSGPSPSTWAARRELFALIDEVIEDLGSAERRSLHAWLQSEDWRAQVEREGIGRSSLRARVSRAFARLRALIRERDPDLVPASSSG